MSTKQALSALFLAFAAVCGGASPASADRAFVVNSGDDSISVIDAETNAVLASPIEGVGSSPWGIGMTPDGTKAYVTDRVEGEVLVIDTTTNGFAASPIEVGAEPLSVAVSPDSPQAYVTNSADGTVSVINTTTDTVSNTISVGGAPYGVAFERSGEKAYVTDFAGDQVTVIDTETETADPVKIPVGGAPYAAAANPVADEVYIANGSEIDSTVSVIDTLTDEADPEKTAVGQHPFSLAVTPDGASVFTANWGAENVSEIDTATKETVGSPTEVGKYPYGIAVSPDGTRVYVTSSEDDSVSVIDIEPAVSSTVVGSAFGSGPVASGVSSGPPIEVGSYPTGIAFTTAPGPGEGGSPEGEPSEEGGEPSEGGGSPSGGGEGGAASAGSSASSSGSVSSGGAAAGSATPEGTLPPPVLGQSVDVEPAKGVVKIRCKGQRRFKPLAAGARIPLGCLVDTRHGVVVLTAASGRGGGTQTARFWNGLFRVGQTGGRRPYTTLSLRGPLGCGAGQRSTRRHHGSRRGSRHRAQASRRRHKKGGGGRGLWGSGKGHFRTKGRYGSASVRGTIWFVADRCDNSTLFAVRRGVVRVHDATLGRSLNLKAGHRYVARPGRGKRGRR